VTNAPLGPDLRQELHALAERLPETATWHDVIEYARFRAAVSEGHDAIERGEIAGEDEVRRVFAKFGVSAGAPGDR
jgi:predicted transcriptional regulator